MKSYFNHYFLLNQQRDLRFDFIRGIAMTFVIINHLPFSSYFCALTVERIGVVTGAELFVILSGIVTGLIHQKYIAKNGWRLSARKLLNRCKQLYLTIVIVNATVWVIAILTSFGTNLIANNFAITQQPVSIMDVAISLKNILILRSTPSQINILGLYVVLLLLTPFALWLLKSKKWFILLLLSFIVYLTGFEMEIRLTDLSFETSYPLLCWQFPFVCALTAGYHYNYLTKIIHSRVIRAVRVMAVLLFFVCLFFTLNNYWTGEYYAVIPTKFRLSFIKPDDFDNIYFSLFNVRTWMWPGRLINAFVVIAFLCEALHLTWPFTKKFVGWFFIPIGQDSLNVFLFHLFLVALLEPFARQAEHKVLLSTFIHLGALAVTWIFVTYRPVLKVYRTTPAISVTKAV